MRYSEIVTEIDRIPSSDVDEDFIRQGIRFAMGTKRTLFAKIDTPDGVVRISYGPCEDGALDFIFARDKIAYGYALLTRSEHDGIKGYAVAEIGLLDKLRHQGIGAKFYRLLLDRGFTLFSGAQQTPDGQRMWKKLAAMPDVEVLVGKEDGLYGPDEVDAYSEFDHLMIARKLGAKAAVSRAAA